MYNEFNECIIWNEPSVWNIMSAWMVNDNEINHLYECIIELNDSLGAGGEDRDLLIIYTNKTKEEIIPLIEWVEDQEKYLFFRQVLVTCK